MLIIFGFRSRVHTAAMLQLACRNGHVASHRLAKIVRWFTLFFIPVIPFSTRYVTVCAQCGMQAKWTKQEAEAMTAHHAQSINYPVDPVSPPLHQGAVTQVVPTPPAALPAFSMGSNPVAGATPGSLPAPQVAPGWYADPGNADAERWWDGNTWSATTRGRS